MEVRKSDGIPEGEGRKVVFSPVELGNGYLSVMRSEILASLVIRSDINMHLMFSASQQRWYSWAELQGLRSTSML